MPKLEYFLLSEDFSVDASTNRLSAWSLLDQVTTPDLPVVLPRLVAIACVRFEASDFGVDYQGVVQMLGASPGTQAIRDSRINFCVKGVRHRLLFSMGAQSLDIEGEYVLDFSLNGAHMATHILDVRRG